MRELFFYSHLNFQGVLFFSTLSRMYETKTKPIEIKNKEMKMKLAGFGLLPEGPQLPLMRNKSAHGVRCFSRVETVSERFS